MAQFVSYSGAGNSPIYYQPTPFAPEPPYGSLHGYGIWQKISPFGGQSNVEVKIPERSMIAEYYANRQPYVQFSAQQAPLQSLGYNPALGLTQGTGLYQPSIGNLLSSPTAMATPTGSYGAARFLGNTGGGLLGLNFGLNNYANGASSYNPTVETLSNNSNIVNLGSTSYDLSKAQGDVIQSDGKLTFGNISDIFRTVIPNPVITSNGQQTYGNIMEAGGAFAQNYGINND